MKAAPGVAVAWLAFAGRCRSNDRPPADAEWKRHVDEFAFYCFDVRDNRSGEVEGQKCRTSSILCDSDRAFSNSPGKSATECKAWMRRMGSSASVIVS
jgi:hypothetical protein